MTSAPGTFNWRARGCITKRRLRFSVRRATPNTIIRKVYSRWSEFGRWCSCRALVWVVEKSGFSAADSIVIDLEDGVPAHDRAAARSVTKAGVASLSAVNKRGYVRINRSAHIYDRKELSVFFHKLVEGSEFSAGGRTLTESDLSIACMISGDWHPVHSDESYAKERGLPSRLFHGPFGLLIATDMATKLPYFSDENRRGDRNSRMDLSGADLHRRYGSCPIRHSQ
jgi:hypothetical protein